MEHVDIPDGERHEPKGAGSAANNAFLKSNGNGTTSFTLMTLSNITDLSRMPTEPSVPTGGSATASDNATAINSLITKLKAAGLMA